MNPRIIAINGPFNGTTWELSEEEFSIGRELSNRLSLDDPLLSRQHCVIRKLEDGFTIYDLGSHNGTVVNNLVVVERPLHHGDYIRVGTSLFRFLSDETLPALASTEVQLDDEELLTISTVKLRVEDAVSRLARDLSVLMKISTKISTMRGLENIKRELLRLIFEAIPAERGAILFGRETLNDPSSAFGLNRNTESLQTIKLSRTIVQQVMREGVGILGNDVLEAQGFDTVKSLAALNTRALLSVPLLLRDEVQGLIYLDTRDPNIRFNEGHLSLLTAVAGIASIALDNALRIEWLESENERLLGEIRIESSIVGSSEPMQETFRFIAKVAPSPSNVLIRGESGTGKELLARAIHTNSPRAGKPFVAINCAALSEALLESELFGHEKGAFTSANARKKGKLEIAEGGTVFLDEVGELAAPLQAKLLRVLQERKMERVGGVHPIELDIRLITATNRNLEEAMAAGAFRRDLYYRLNVVSYTMPQLKDRREDIPLLAQHFVVKHSARCNRRVTGVSPEAVQYLMDYDWPGNVRELENVIERAVVLGSTTLIAPDDLPEDILSSGRAPKSILPAGLYEALRNAKKELILKALEQTKYNNVEAAALLKIHPNNLHRLVRSMGLKEPPRTA